MSQGYLVLRAMSCIVMILLFNQYLISRSPHCFIKTDDPITLSSQPRISSFSQSVDYFDRIAWSNFGPLKLADEECSKRHLAPCEKSEAMQITNFDSDIICCDGQTVVFSVSADQVLEGMNAEIHFNMQMPLAMYSGYDGNEDQAFNTSNTSSNQVSTYSSVDTNSRDFLTDSKLNATADYKPRPLKSISNSSSFISAIYPNPNSGNELIVVFGNVDELPEFRIQIVNTAGKILDVIEGTDKPMYKSKLLRCELSNYRTGNYILQMMSKKGTENHRFVEISP